VKWWNKSKSERSRRLVELTGRVLGTLTGLRRISDLLAIADVDESFHKCNHRFWILVLKGEFMMQALPPALPLTHRDFRDFRHQNVNNAERVLLEVEDVEHIVENVGILCQKLCGFLQVLAEFSEVS
jgi:hypothetical protein